MSTDVEFLKCYVMAIDVRHILPFLPVKRIEENSQMFCKYLYASGTGQNASKS
jgi:hypothetical protein